MDFSSRRAPRLAPVFSLLCSMVMMAATAWASPSDVVAGKRKIGNFSGDPGISLGNGDLFGSSVARLGDVDHDGVPDVAVGARGTNGSGAVYVLLMNANRTVKSSHEISAATPMLAALLGADDDFGRSVAGIGDVDGDGIPDLAVGAPNDDDKDADNNGVDDGDGINRGAIYIILLDSAGNPADVHKISDLDAGLALPNNAEQFGRSVASLGDLDGPGGSAFTLAVGASGDRDGDALPSFLRGAVYVLFMSHSGGSFVVDHVQKLSDTQGTPASLHLRNADAFGSAVAAVGDLNGDGVADLAVGAPLDDDNTDGDSSIGANRGAVYVLYLAPDGTAPMLDKISALAPTGFAGTLTAANFFGDAVAATPDLDGDGFPDLIVGASGDDDGASGAGAAWVLLLHFDGGSIHVTRQFKISSTTGGFGGGLDLDDSFAPAVANLGDIDGDGKDDVIAGAPGDDDGAGSAGAAYLLRVAQTATALALSPADPHCADDITITATVSPASATGTVELFEGATPRGTTTLASGVATFLLPARPVGTYDGFTVRYFGDSDNLGNTSPEFSVAVTLATATTSIVSDMNPAKAGLTVTLTATVAPVAAGGSVEFFEGSTSLGPAVTLSGGTAAFPISSLTPGHHLITAHYSGNACYGQSPSSALDLEIVPDMAPSVLVTYPDGGETLAVDGDAPLAWTATDDNRVTSVDLYISRDNGNSYEPIALDEANDGAYLWHVTGPGTNTGDVHNFTALFKVVAHDNIAQAGQDQSNAPFEIFDITTEALLSMFQAEPVPGGLELRWRFSTDRFSSVTLERADHAAGPWTPIPAETRAEGGVTIAVDRTAVGGKTYFYRLAAALPSGQRAYFGPLSGTAGAAIAAFELMPAFPNPTGGSTQVEFAVPREARVRVSIVDVQGRDVAVLATGIYRPGRYQAMWSGEGSHGAVPAGLYFVRYQTPARSFTQRLVVTQ